MELRLLVALDDGAGEKKKTKSFLNDKAELQLWGVPGKTLEYLPSNRDIRRQESVGECGGSWERHAGSLLVILASVSRVRFF